MKYTFSLLLIWLIALNSCQQHNDIVSPELETQISDSLVKIANDFIKSWEPPFHEEMSLKDFSKANDFCLVIDGFYIDNYEQWKSVVPESMEHERLHYKKYSHKIHDTRVKVLSSKSGVVTIVYTWKYTTDEDKEFHEDGAITFVCYLESDDWKIVHYHGSHGNQVLINDNQSQQ